MKIKNRQDLLMVLTIAVAALYVTVNFILSPLEDVWKARQGQIKELRERVMTGNRMIQYGKDTRANWETMRAKALPFDTSLAEQKLIRSFASWAGESGAQITSITPQWKNDSTNYMTLGCRVEATGGLGTLAKFIHDVERGSLALRLDTVELSTHDTTGQQLTLGLEVNGLALAQQQEKK
jgi:Tfp pilus assembly protein PilO